MTKNSSKIKEGIRALSNKPCEIISGTMVPGSLNEREYTISVLPSDGSRPIDGVILNAITGDENGMILFPKDECNVVIGSIDGPGEWTLIKASELTKAIIKIDNVSYKISSEEVNVQNGSVVFNIGTSVYKVNTASESLFQLLKDCFTYLTELTVATSTGPSGTPINVADFTNLLTRLNNLLAA